MHKCTFLRWEICTLQSFSCCVYWSSLSFIFSFSCWINICFFSLYTAPLSISLVMIQYDLLELSLILSFHSAVPFSVFLLLSRVSLVAGVVRILVVENSEIPTTESTYEQILLTMLSSSHISQLLLLIWIFLSTQLFTQLGILVFKLLLELFRESSAFQYVFLS